MGARLIYDGSREVSCVETFTCPHHNTIHDRYTADGRKRDLPYCRKCMRPVCELCVIIESRGGDMCVPYEKKLDRLERRLAAARAREGLLKACGR
jgi:hypothetical protein